MEAIILAGGLGTRLRPVVSDVPKPMVPVKGRPFLEYQLNYWIAQGVTRFVLSVGYKAGIIISHFGNAYREASLDYVVENKPLGTGGGLRLAVEKIFGPNPILVLNGDSFFEVPLAVLHEFQAEKRADVAFSLFSSGDQNRYMGMQIDAEGRVLALKATGKSTPALANGGVYLLNPDIILGAPHKPGDSFSLEDDFFPGVLKSGKRLYALQFAGRFIDIGVPEDYRRAAEVLN